MGQKVYEQYYEKFQRRKNCYHESANFFHRLDLFFILFPTMLLQVVIAILSVYSAAEVKNEKTIVTSKSERLTVAIQVTIVALSTFSTVLLGARQKLKWTDRSIKFEATAKMFSRLQDSTTIYKNQDLNSPAENRTQLMEKYLEHINAIEKQTADCDLPPARIKSKYLTDEGVRKEERAARLEESAAKRGGFYWCCSTI